MKTYISVLSCFFLLSVLCNGNVILPSIFGDHMVLQEGTDLHIWGWAKAGEEITIYGTWDNDNRMKTKADPQGHWKLTLPTTPSNNPGPHELHVQGHNHIIINDVLIGEVWLGSGQSNMEWSANMGIDDTEAEITNANYTEIRFFNVGHISSQYPQRDVSGEWVKCTPESMRITSAVGYFFSRDLHLTLDRPVGFINSSWGGTPAEIWVSEDAIANDYILSDAATILQQEPWGPKDPGRAYNAMIRPLAPYSIKGVLWYQGESNVPNAHSYQRLLSILIDQWRGLWGHDFPFYFAQIAPFKYGNDHINGAIVRDQQRRVLNETSKTGMVVVSDIGNIDDIHPRNKQDVGHRFASLALHHDYGIDQNSTSGPLYKSHVRKGNKTIVYFDHVESGLHSEGPIHGFEIAGTDGHYYPAEAKIVKYTIELVSDSVQYPEMVRFAMKNTFETTLRNGDGLPASCFASHTDY